MTSKANRTSDWYSAGGTWTNRKAITIDHTKVPGGSSLSGFPMLFAVTDANLKTVANGGLVGKSDGTDILFTAADGTTKLDHEIELYNAATGQVAAWVKIPTLSGTTATAIHIYYGNASASNQQNTAGVWSGNYKIVNHFKETSGNTTDSSGNNNSGVPSGGATSTSAGLTGNGYSLNGSTGLVTVANHSSWATTTTDMTLEFWFKPNSAAGDYLNILSMGNWGSATRIFELANGTLNAQVAQVASPWATVACATGALAFLTTPDGKYHHLAMTYTSGLFSLYVDGALNCTNIYTTGGAILGDSSNGICLGGACDALRTNGAIDELRISIGTMRSANWLATEFNNLNSPATFYSVGGQQGGGSGGVPVTITSAPAGLSMTVDGAGCTAPCGVQWTPGTSHTIATTATQAGATGTQYVFASWSDSGALSHAVTAPGSSVTYTASFTTQYFLTTAASTGGTINPASGWYNSGAVVAVSASASGGYQFNGFSGALSGTTTPQNVTMNGAASVTATFGTGSGGANLITNYTYDLLNNVAQVSMPRAAGTQTRTFNYNNGVYLQSATNPETGTVNYTYTAAGNVATKIDAKGQKIAYSYDAYNRLTQVQKYPSPGTVEDTCQRVSFYYDTDPFTGTFSEYGWGRGTGVEYGSTAASCGSAFPTQFTERYSYTKGGLVTKKRLTVTANIDTQGGTNLRSRNLDTEQTYDNEGKALTVKYPDAIGPDGETGAPVVIPGAKYTYTYDGMGRPITLADDRVTPVNWVTNVQYGASNELKQMDYRIGAGLNSSGKLDYQGYQGEARTYNIRGQLTRITGGLDVEYRYSTTQNNGQITQMKDWVSGEEVSYQYDSLQRLISAVTTGPEWGQSYTYDGFGNRTGAAVTKGSAPNSSMVYDTATNRILGGSYDANGNMLTVQGSTLAYDVDNRVASATVSGGTEYYAYRPDNKRIWKLKANGTVELYYYGIGGQKLGTYNVTRTVFANTLTVLAVDVNVYFGAKVIVSRSGPAVRDRLGSSRTGGSKYYPYGEEQQVTAHDRDKFGTYYRDGGTGLDYAQNRYYANTLGRFTSPDPYTASGGPGDPGSWNKYGYVQNDPINYVDPRGNTRYIVGNLEIDCPDEEGDESPCHFHRLLGSAGGGDIRIEIGRDPGSRDTFTPIKIDPNGLESGVTKAIAALHDKVTCRDLFNGDAIALLLNLMGGSTQGIIVFGDLGPPVGGSVTAANTLGILGRSAQGTSIFTGATVTINSNLDAPWYGGYPDRFGIGNATSTATQNIYRAITVLHELGHVANRIDGWGGSDIQEDSDPAVNRANTQLVFDNCFRP